MNNDFENLKRSVVKLLVNPSDELDKFHDLNQLREWLIENVEWLIDHDFERLLHILYRIDVNELKVKRLIAENEGENASEIISDLIIEREKQKVESRRIYSDPSKDTLSTDDEETWN